MATPVRHASDSQQPAAPLPPLRGTGDGEATTQAGRRRRVRRLLTGAGAVLALLIGAGTIIAGLAARHLQGNITARDITAQLGSDRPQAAPVRASSDGRAQTALNILVIGSDSRDGDNRFIGGKADEGRSDTTLLLHLSADRTSATAVSIPRDSMVAMPTCTDRAGHPSPAGLRQFNDAYTIGGAACTVRTVEQLTRIRVDHYVVIDFAGFTNVVDALGGVGICLPAAVDDRSHHITLPAGRSRVNGTQALAYVRERYALGDGGDLSRIGRQQAFLSSVLQQATSAGTLGNPVRLYQVLDAATRSLTTDPGLAGLGQLTDLAAQVHAIGLGNIRFLTVPTGAYPADPNRVAWTAGAADLWRALRADRPIVVRGSHDPDVAPSGSSSASAVRVRVLDGSGHGLGGRAADQLDAAGFTVVGGGTATGAAHSPAAATTFVEYGPGQLAHARTLAAALPFAELVPDRALSRTIVVVVGRDWIAPTASTAARTSGGTAPPTSADAVVVTADQDRTADADICAG
jgi:LCP family protein required for cell wall assembly